MDVNVLKRTSAAKWIASVFGTLGGLGGVIHGIGEVFQGNTRPGSMFFASWARGPIALYLDGDPALSIIPNFLYTGIAAITVSVAAIAWSCLFLERRHGGQVLVLIAVLMLLLGGGVGPPTLALLAGVAALGISSPYSWWRAHLPGHARKMLAVSWPWVFAVCVVNGVLLVPGHVIAVYYFAPVEAALFLNSFYLAVIMLIASIVSGIACDISRQERGPDLGP